MTKVPRVNIGEMFARGTPIDEAMNEAAAQAVERHRQAGVPLVVWNNGRVERIPIEQLSPARPVIREFAPPDID